MMTSIGSTSSTSSTDHADTEEDDATRNTATSTIAISETTSSNTPASNRQRRRPVCAYRNAATENGWQARRDLSELHVGQELRGVVVDDPAFTQNTNNNKRGTGPKVWIDAGVGRYRAPLLSSDSISSRPKRNPWKVCYALLRLGGAGMKPSIARKKVTKLRQAATGFPVYVSRIYPAQGQWEVVLERPTNTSETQPVLSQPHPPLQSSSQLQPGTVVRGTVERVEPYGCLVRLDGYNRPGLLHVQRVADLYGRFIQGTDGLIEAGLERRARVELQVRSNAGRGKLFLDFTDAVLQEAAAEQQQRLRDEAPGMTQQRQNVEATKEMVLAGSSASSNVAPISEAKSVGSEHDSETSSKDDEEGYDNDDDEYDDDYDDYDEERDIEDALGLGTY